MKNLVLGILLLTFSFLTPLFSEDRPYGSDSFVNWEPNATLIGKVSHQKILGNEDPHFLFYEVELSDLWRGKPDDKVIISAVKRVGDQEALQGRVVFLRPDPSHHVRNFEKLEGQSIYQSAGSIDLENKGLVEAAKSYVVGGDRLGWIKKYVNSKDVHLQRSALLSVERSTFSLRESNVLLTVLVAAMAEKEHRHPTNFMLFAQVLGESGFKEAIETLEALAKEPFATESDQLSVVRALTLSERGLDALKQHIDAETFGGRVLVEAKVSYDLHRPLRNQPLNDQILAELKSKLHGTDKEKEEAIRKSRAYESSPKLLALLKEALFSKDIKSGDKTLLGGTFTFFGTRPALEIQRDFIRDTKQVKLDRELLLSSLVMAKDREVVLELLRSLKASLPPEDPVLKKVQSWITIHEQSEH